MNRNLVLSEIDIAAIWRAVHIVPHTLDAVTVIALKKAIEGSTEIGGGGQVIPPLPYGGGTGPATWPSVGSNYPHVSDGPFTPPPTPKPTAEKLGPEIAQQMASGVYPPGAWKYIGQITQRQIDTWDTTRNVPGESLGQSVEFVRWNSWDTRDYYIPDAYNSNLSLNPSDAGYRPPPGAPGYYGPYGA